MRLAPIAFALTLAATPALAAPCGGSFSGFLDALKDEARQRGFSQDEADRFFRTAAQDPKVIRADRGQGVFRKTFIEFSRSLISQGRVSNGAAMSRKWDAVFDRAARDYGVPRGILLAFWAFETDYGAV